MLILNWREPCTHMERHLGPVTHKGQEWAHKNQVCHHWSSALRRTAHRRAPCQQQTTSLHNVPPSQSAHYVSAVPTCVQTSQLTPYQLRVGTGGHSYWMPMAWQEWRNAPIWPIWWYAKPDAIIISETHLHSDVHNAWVYATGLQYALAEGLGQVRRWSTHHS